MKCEDGRILARFRYGNETKAREYLKEEGEKRCKLRRRKEEDKKCEITRGPKDMRKVLNETAEGLTELKVIIEKRRVNDNKYSKEAKAQSCNSF